MASTSYLARVIWKEHADNEANFAGEYSLLLAAKTIPSPVQAPNTVESTTLEDDTQTFEMGIKQSSSREVTWNLSKDDLDALDAKAGTKLDIFHLYGEDGLGGVAKYAYVGEVVATPSEVGGVDSILEMTATIVTNTVAQKVTDAYTITYNSSTKKFTVTAST